MKKTLTIIGLLASTAGLYAQGTIAWQDQATGFQISVLSPTTANTETQGNTSSDKPAGSTAYTGSVFIGGTTTGSGPTGYFNGNNFTVGIYMASSQAAVSTLLNSGTPVATSTFDTTYGANQSGVWQTTSLVSSDPNIAPGTAAYVELAAWYNNGGTVTSYAAAVAAGDPAGFSDISTSEATLGGQGASGPPLTPPSLSGLGLTSFSLVSVPEPSTIALGVMGVSALLIRRRK